MTLPALLRVLRKRAHSVNNTGGEVNFIPGAKCIGSGCDRAAYRVGEYVVKARADIRPSSNKAPVKQFKNLGLACPKQWFVNGWVVQPFYKRLTEREHTKLRQINKRGWSEFNYFLDLHYWNVGTNAKKQLVAFDW